MNFILGVWLALCHVASKARTSMRELSSTRMSGRARSSSRDSDGGSPSTRDEESGDSPTTPRTPKSPKSPPRTLTEVTILTFGTVEQVMKSKFMIAQVVFNTIGSLAGPTMCFWLIFDLGGDPPYEWWGPQVMGIIILTNFISGILCNVLGPLGLPEALKKGWFVIIRESSVPWWLLPVIKVRRGIPRYVAIGLAIAPLYWPPAIPLARYVVGPTFATWTQIWFGVCYCIAVAPAVTIFGCLAFALEPNYRRIEDMMSNHKSPCKRLALRFVGCLKLLW